MINANMIDATLLKPEATPEQVRSFCAKALEGKPACVMVNPCYVPLCVEMAQGPGVSVGTVIDFPLGAGTVEDKVAQAREAVRLGAGDIDLVVGLRYAKSGDYEGLRACCHAVREVTQGKVLKIILETAMLSADEIAQATQACCEAGVDFVKTSSGFVGGGASAKAVTIMKQVTDAYNAAHGTAVAVKASGGIRTKQWAEELVAAGAARLGASDYVALLGE